MSTTPSDEPTQADGDEDDAADELDGRNGARWVPPFQLPDEQVALLFGGATALPLGETPSDEVLGAGLRSLLAAGLIVLTTDPEGGETPVAVPLAPLSWVQQLMSEATSTTLMTLSAGEHPRVYALYRTALGELLLEEAIAGGFRTYVSYSPESLRADIDTMLLETPNGEPAAYEGSIPDEVVLTAPFDGSSDDAEVKRLHDALDLLLSCVRRDPHGSVEELTLAEGVHVGRFRLVAEPAPPAAATRLVVSRGDWSGATVVEFVDR